MSQRPSTDRLTRVLPASASMRLPHWGTQKFAASSAVGEPTDSQWHPSSLDLQSHEFIGRGASSHVFRGQPDSRSSSAASCITAPRIAVKFPLEQSWHGQRVLRNEYIVMRRLQHPAIARVYGVKRFGPHLGMVMEHLKPGSIFERIREDLAPGALPNLKRVSQIFTPLVDALVAMHDRGWVHGDLKPDHIMWRDSQQPVWIDFETATQQVRQHWETSRSQTNGTFEYLAPEAITSMTLHPQADMFSLGRILAQVLCGRAPTWDPVYAPEECDQRIISQLPENTPEDLQRMCALTMRHIPDQRPTAREMLRVLLRYGDHRTFDQVTVNLEEASEAKERTGPLSPQTQSSIARTASAPEESCPRVTLAYCDESQLECIESQFLVAGGDEPRLVVRSHADHPMASPFSALQGLWGQLSDWLSSIPVELLRSWQPPCEQALAVSANDLSEAFGVRPIYDRDPNLQEIEQAINCIVRILERVAQQRRVVLVIHRLEWIDRESARFLQQLLSSGRRSNIAIFATCCSDTAMNENDSAQLLVHAATTCS